MANPKPRALVGATLCLVRQPRSKRGGSMGRRVAVQKITARSGCDRGSGKAAAHLVGARGLVQAVDAGQMTVLPAAHAQQEANDIAADPIPSRPIRIAGSSGFGSRRATYDPNEQQRTGPHLCFFFHSSSTYL
jgi:hypothetical protein